jgi:outer membrane protein OmpA-like peptidoglycan-associated protein
MIVMGAVASMALGTSASAANPGWYLSLEGGANWIDDWSPVVGKGQVADVQFDTGWAVIGSVGYAFTQNWRTEVEFGYRKNDISTVVADLTWENGDMWEASVMANVLYDIHVASKLGVSLGVGAGADYANFTDSRSAIEYSDEDWNFAYQGLVGLNYALGSRTTAFVNYRYFRVTSPSFDMVSQGGYLFEGDDIVKHTVTAGLRYALGAPAATPEAPASSPQPPAVEPGPSRPFIVFFGFNKYNLTSAALRVISEAVVAAKENGSATVVITGHTDTMGSPDFNQKLSMRRSNAVKAEMVRQGVSSANISTTGKGESELLVQTGDNVKEPQNRRATIDLN